MNVCTIKFEILNCIYICVYNQRGEDAERTQAQMLNRKKTGEMLCREQVLASLETNKIGFITLMDRELRTLFMHIGWL